MLPHFLCTFVCFAFRLSTCFTIFCWARKFSWANAGKARWKRFSTEEGADKCTKREVLPPCLENKCRQKWSKKLLNILIFKPKNVVGLLMTSVRSLQSITNRRVQKVFKRKWIKKRPELKRQFDYKKKVIKVSAGQKCKWFCNTVSVYRLFLAINKNL